MGQVRAGLPRASAPVLAARSASTRGGSVAAVRACTAAWRASGSSGGLSAPTAAPTRSCAGSRCAPVTGRCSSASLAVGEQATKSFVLSTRSVGAVNVLVPSLNEAEAPVGGRFVLG